MLKKRPLPSSNLGCLDNSTRKRALPNEWKELDKWGKRDSTVVTSESKRCPLSTNNAQRSWSCCVLQAYLVEISVNHNNSNNLFCFSARFLFCSASGLFRWQHPQTHSVAPFEMILKWVRQHWFDSLTIVRGAPTRPHLLRACTFPL